MIQPIGEDRETGHRSIAGEFWAFCCLFFTPPPTPHLCKSQRHLLVMEGHGPQKSTPLARDLTRAFNSYNKHTVLLKKNLKETHAFFREMRQNYSNTCASSTLSSDSASLETSKSAHRPGSCQTRLSHTVKLLCHRTNDC